MSKEEVRIASATADDVDVVAEMFDLYRQFYEQAADLAKSRAEPFQECVCQHPRLAARAGIAADGCLA